MTLWSDEFWGLLMGSYILSIIIVLFSGGVPTKWQTWPMVHLVALSFPILAVASSVLVAIPGLMVLGLVVAATTR